MSNVESNALVNPEQRSIGEVMSALAIDLAAKEDKGMSEAIASVIKAEEEWQGGPFKVLFAMHNTYGDAIEQFPDPSDETSNNPAKFKLGIQGTDGKMTYKDRDFYILFADATKEGADVANQLLWLKRLGDVNDSRNGIDAAFMQKYGDNPQLREGHKKTLQGRQNTIRNSYRKAMALKHMIAAVNDFTGVEVTPQYTDDTETEVQKVKAPLIMFEQPKDGKLVKVYTHMTIGNFLKLKPRLARENLKPDGTGGYQALLDTLKRKTPGSETTGEQGGESRDKPVAINTVETFHARMTDVHEYLDRAFTSRDKRDHGEILKAVTGAGSDDLFMSLWDVRDMLNDLLKGDVLAVRRQKLEQEQKQAAA